MFDKQINSMGNSSKGLNYFTTMATSSFHKSYFGAANADILEMKVFILTCFYLRHIILHL